jgi:hypothetical protein
MSRFLKICFALVLLLSALTGCRTETGEWRTERIEQPVASLEMEVGAADITIRIGKTLRVETDNPYITAAVQGDTLVIREKHHIGNLESSHLILELPKGTTFRSVDLELGAGRLTAESLICDRLNMDLGTGQTVIEYIDVTREAEIHGGVGELMIRAGNIRNLDLELGVGNGVITALLIGQAEIEAGIGNLDLTVLAPASDYTVRAKAGIGGVFVNDVSVKDGSIGTGPNMLEISGGIGKVSVVFGKI